MNIYIYIACIYNHSWIVMLFTREKEFGHGLQANFTLIKGDLGSFMSIQNKQG